MSKQAPKYLKPYLDASRVHGGGFGALLWATPETQAARFRAFTQVVDFHGLSVLDVGCGRGDLLDYLHSVGQVPQEYVGIEMVPALAQAAESMGVRILRRDFVSDPACMFIGSDVVVFCGSLNTVEDEEFYSSIKRGFDATAHVLAFNFLCSTNLAGASHLYWRKAEAVNRYCRNVLGFGPEVVEGYMDGDMTFVLRKPRE